MFELSHRLIGIYKTANATQSMPYAFSPLCVYTDSMLGIAIDNHVLVPTKTVAPVTASTS